MHHNRQPPLTLEDRTGQLTNSDFDDMYDRRFFHVARVSSSSSPTSPFSSSPFSSSASSSSGSPTSISSHTSFYSSSSSSSSTTPPSSTSIRIYEMNIRASRHRSSLPLTTGIGEPIVQLDFMPDESLGSVSFFVRGSYGWGGGNDGSGGKVVSLPMSKYLRKTGFFGGSLSRRFLASDGREYKWGFHTHAGQEWSCTTAADNYLVAHYDLKPANVRAYDVSGNSLTIYEPWQSIAGEILCTLVIMRHIWEYKL